LNSISVFDKVLKIIGAIYMEPLTSQLPLAFQEFCESFEERRNVERKILEALQQVATMGEGLN
jgi:hypothetical protein